MKMSISKTIVAAAAVSAFTPSALFAYWYPASPVKSNVGSGQEYGGDAYADGGGDWSSVGGHLSAPGPCSMGGYSDFGPTATTPGANLTYAEGASSQSGFNEPGYSNYGGAYGAGNGSTFGAGDAYGYCQCNC